MTQVGEWRKFNFRWARTPVCCWGLASLPCLAVRPYFCRPGGATHVEFEEIHRINKTQEVPGRQLLLDRLLWTETRSTNGSVTQWPRVGGGRPSDTEQPGPETVPTIIVL